MSSLPRFVNLNLGYDTQLPLSSHPQEGEEAETAEDREFIDDSMRPNNENHSMGDDEQYADMLIDPADLYVPGRCMNVLGYDDDDDPVICGDACNPSEQLCHFCRVSAHRMTFL